MPAQYPDPVRKFGSDIGKGREKGVVRIYKPVIQIRGIIILSQDTVHESFTEDGTASGRNAVLENIRKLRIV